jgi:hypothetical protein
MKYGPLTAPKNSKTFPNRIAFLVRFTLYICETSLVLLVFNFELYSGYIDNISDSCNLVFSSMIHIYDLTSL